MESPIVRFCGNVRACIARDERPFYFAGLLVNLDTNIEHRITMDLGAVMLAEAEDRIAAVMIGQSIHEGFRCLLDSDENGRLIITSRLPSIGLKASP